MTVHECKFCSLLSNINYKNQFKTLILFPYQFISSAPLLQIITVRGVQSPQNPNQRGGGRGGSRVIIIPIFLLLRCPLRYSIYDFWNLNNWTNRFELIATGDVGYTFTREYYEKSGFHFMFCIRTYELRSLCVSPTWPHTTNLILPPPTVHSLHLYYSVHVHHLDNNNTNKLPMHTGIRLMHTGLVLYCSLFISFRFRCFYYFLKPNTRVIIQVHSC